jgi:hypothetical protein
LKHRIQPVGGRKSGKLRKCKKSWVLQQEEHKSIPVAEKENDSLGRSKTEEWEMWFIQ